MFCSNGCAILQIDDLIHRTQTLREGVVEKFVDEKDLPASIRSLGDWIQRHFP